MATKKETRKTGTLPAEIVEKGRDLWLAGLGAVATVEKEGQELLTTFEKRGEKLLAELQKEANRLFDELVKRGEKLQKKGVKRLEAVAEEVEETQKGMGKKFDELVKETVESVLARLDMPTRSEVQALTKKVEALSTQVDALTALLQGERKAEAGPEVASDAPAVDWTVYLVTPREDGWAVVKEGDAEPLAVHETKVAAVDAARELARQTEPSKLIIYRKDGSVQDVNTYGG